MKVWGEVTGAIDLRTISVFCITTQFVSYKLIEYTKRFSRTSTHIHWRRRPIQLPFRNEISSDRLGLYFVLPIDLGFNFSAGNEKLGQRFVNSWTNRTRRELLFQQKLAWDNHVSIDGPQRNF